MHGIVRFLQIVPVVEDQTAHIGRAPSPMRPERRGVRLKIMVELNEVRTPEIIPQGSRQLSAPVHQAPAVRVLYKQEVDCPPKLVK